MVYHRGLLIILLVLQGELRVDPTAANPYWGFIGVILGLYGGYIGVILG